MYIINKNVFWGCLISFCISAYSGVFPQGSELYNLDKLTEMALQNNHLLKITRLRVGENEEKVKEVQSKYLPQISINAGYLHVTDVPSINASKGSLGILPLSGGIKVPLPMQDLTIVQGEHDMSMAGVVLVQPVTQLTKIKTGVAFSEKETAIARKEAEKAELQIRQGIEKLYFGLLISMKQKEEILIKIDLVNSKLNDVENALASGKTIELNKTGLLANLADEEQNLLKINNQIEDYFADLKHQAGIPSDKQIRIEEKINLGIQNTDNAEYYSNNAMTGNHELRIAYDKKEKAELGYTAAWKEYIPDLGIVAGYSYQPKIEYIPKNNFYVGAIFQWNVWDWGARKKVMNQRELLEQQADENIANVREQVSNDVEKAYRKLKHAVELIEVVEKVVKYRNQDFEFQNNKQESGLNLKTDRLSAKAALVKAETDLLSAKLNYRIALTELKILTGSF